MSDFANAAIIGANIKAARTQKNWTQQTLAEKSGMTNTQISAYERGKKAPTLDSLATMSSALEVSMDYLYFGDESESFINSAPDEGRQIVNSIYKLRELGVIDMSTRHSGLDLKKHWTPIRRLLETLREFDSIGSTYPEPESYLAMLKDSITNEINQEIEKKQVSKLKEIIVAPANSK